MDDSSKKLKDLQDRLQTLIKGSFQKDAKALVSSANTTLLRAQDTETRLIAEFLEVTGRRPDSTPLVEKRVNRHPAKKRSRTVTATVTTVEDTLPEIDRR